MSKIDDKQFASMLELNWKIKSMADFFGVDKSTIYKKKKALNIVRIDPGRSKIIKCPTIKTKEIPKYAEIQKNIREDFAVEPYTKLDIVSFDIETTNLTADFSVLLCACIKPFGRDAIVFRIDDYNKKWSTERMDDSGIVKAIACELVKHAIIITHYGSKFDLPYMKAKMSKYGLIPLPPLFNIDTWRIAKNNFQVSSRKLANLSRYFELGSKSGVEGDLWLQAGMNGNVAALDKIIEHNIQDVILLEKLAAISFPYVKSIPKS